MRRITLESLRLEKVSFGYENHALVFDKLDFAIPNASLSWIKGAPGAGKSSLLKVFGGLLYPSAGRYLINDQNVLEMSFTEFLPYRLALGYSFDLGGLLTNRTLFENLMLPLLFHQLCTPEEAEERVKYWMDRFDLAKVANERPFSVTGGQRKSAVVLRAFIHRPQVVFLDDPMAGLKEDGRNAFTELVQTHLKTYGLKKLVFSAERELPLKMSVKEVFLEAA
jgi:phospholipid/cholesterol/gamma-HCH transport system ATP-binding protein